MVTADDRPSFEALFDAAPDAMLLVGSDGRIRLANERTADLFGYDAATLEGEPIEILVPEDVREDHAELRNAYFDDPERRPMGAGLDLEGQREDGSTFRVDIGLSPVGEGAVLATVRDISDRLSLRRKYRALLSTIPDAVVVTDVDSGEIVEVNDGASALFGRDRADLIGSHQTSLHPAGQEERYRDLFERRVAAGTAVFSSFPDGDDILVETADEQRVPVEINGRVARLDDHPVLIGVFRDVSERRAYQRDLERQLDRVETLANILSHDLRGPLNVAEGYLDRARTDEATVSESLDKVADAHDRMETIIDDVLTMLTETGEPDLGPVHLRETATECWSAVTGTDGTLVVRDDAVFEADRRQVRHVFENLFRNAVEHGADESGSGVTVTVGVLDVASGIFVADDGPGIPPSDREAILDPGYTTRPGGTGLGLVIVAEVANAHGWDLSITESAAGGARFEFTGVSILGTGPSDG
ncbi:MAG: PAS domain S-box protein [Halobacteriaceae archaeon]